MLINNNHLTELQSPNQTIKARVEFYKGSTLEKVCNCDDMLSEFTVEKTGEGRFFGFGICQKLRTSLIDLDRVLNPTTEHTIEASFGVNGDYIYPFPKFYIYEQERDETTGIVSITAYDALYEAINHTVAELGLPAPYTIKGFVVACANLLGIPLNIKVEDDSFNTYFEDGAQFEGTENIRAALNAVAEATQTVYFISNEWELTFIRLKRDEDAVLTIDKNSYIDLFNGGPCVLNSITHTTELEDSVTAGEGGTTQYVRDNPFWELRTDIGLLLENALARVGGTSVHQFECTWTGNYLLEIGDKIKLIADDDSEITTYVLDDSITFDGTLLQVTRWTYDENKAETAENPTNLGDALNATYARVDKVNKRIDLVVSDVGTNSNKLASLELNTGRISASVSSVSTNMQTQINSLDERIETVSKRASLAMTEDDVQIAIEEEVSDGVTKVRTETGFTFDNEGLTVEKSDSEMKTQITEDGMTVYKSGTEVLTANNTGVDAVNLRATTYLIVGNNSRFEDYTDDNGTSRTACFWIGR